MVVVIVVVVGVLEEYGYCEFHWLASRSLVSCVSRRILKTFFARKQKQKPEGWTHYLHHSGSNIHLIQLWVVVIITVTHIIIIVVEEEVVVEEVIEDHAVIITTTTTTTPIEVVVITTSITNHTRNKSSITKMKNNSTYNSTLNHHFWKILGSIL